VRFDPLPPAEGQTDKSSQAFSLLPPPPSLVNLVILLLLNSRAFMALFSLYLLFYPLDLLLYHVTALHHLSPYLPFSICTSPRPAPILETPHWQHVACLLFLCFAFHRSYAVASHRSIAVNSLPDTSGCISHESPKTDAPLFARVPPPSPTLDRPRQFADLFGFR